MCVHNDFQFEHQTLQIGSLLGCQNVWHVYACDFLSFAFSIVSWVGKMFRLNLQRAIHLHLHLHHHHWQQHRRFDSGMPVYCLQCLILIANYAIIWASFRLILQMLCKYCIYIITNLMVKDVVRYVIILWIILKLIESAHRIYFAFLNL